MDDCARICEKTKDCNGFDYYRKGDTDEGDCNLKQGVTKITEDVKDGRIRSGGICDKSGSFF